MTLLEALETHNIIAVRMALEEKKSPNFIFESSIHDFVDCTTTISGYRNESMTPLIYAIDNRLEDIALLLLEHGADPNPQGVFVHPLNLACKHGFEDIVKKLLELEAPINLTDMMHATPLIETIHASMLMHDRETGLLTEASLQTTKNIITHLMKAGATLNPEPGTPFNEKTPIYQAATHNVWKAHQMVVLLMDLGATLNIKDNSGITLLEHFADKNLHLLPSFDTVPLHMRQITIFLDVPPYLQVPQIPNPYGAKLINLVLKKLLHNQQDKKILALQESTPKATSTEQRHEALSIVNACLSRTVRIVHRRCYGLDRAAPLTQPDILPFLDFYEQGLFVSTSKSMQTRHRDDAESKDEQPAKRIKLG